MRDAFHDSSARWPPPLCHPGTRQDYIQNIAGWGIGASRQRILWIYGPAGVGKSAVAQSCANFFTEENNLGAAVFLSRLNGWDDPDRFFTSISYQIAVKTDPYGDFLDDRIQRDPTLVTKSIMVQFQELLVKPVLELRAKGVDVGEWVVIIDGLDECEGKETQCDIIEMISTSAREGALPFRWVFLSRPETHIIASFTTNSIRQISLHLELPVTRAIDNEIRLYLADELQRVQERSRLPDTWPPAHEVAILVNLSAGLWIYPATLIRFIRDPDSSPVDQLNAVLALAKDSKGKTSSGHPLTELDIFYTLIMRRVPSKILTAIQRILLFVKYSSEVSHWSFLRGLLGEIDLPIIIANILGLTELQFQNACSSLHSVLKFKSSSHGITFYHASFMDFLRDATRSKEFCVYSCLNPLRRDLVERLNDVHARSTADHLNMDVTWPWPHPESQRSLYRCSILVLSWLCQWQGPLDPPACTALLGFQFHHIPRLDPSSNLPFFDLVDFRHHIPKEFRSQIIRRCYNPIVYASRLRSLKWTTVWILGRDRNKVVLCWNKYQGWRVVQYPYLV
ncbi:hypothetical protein P691DRAFT_779739 [Macrolepiota fuliginosa MF-IS2]|uniref:Nephrocystin 3-like N-terminal domain-containing protein n=1 Tax=Macrolepiota fuliginosa MF-IS2 TaxID=1400762 RepID=A0A9P6BW85_9AGAR|nr:hypothetical protein P691DRAFT_779739 [Macrolepiota fuliginosa MF-IS2]